MYSIITAAVLLGLVHALIPNHWLPLVAVAKAEKWERSDLLSVAFIIALAHVAGTVILGIILGIIGTRLAGQYSEFVDIIAPLLLIVFGLIYFSVNLPHHHHGAQKEVNDYKKSRTRWILIFVMMMFLSPCLEVESLFLSAGAFGINNVLLLALVYALTSIAGIVSLVMLAFKGIHLVDTSFIEHNEKRITGVILIFVGILTFFIH